MLMLLGQTPDEKTIANVRPDGAYDTRKSHEVIAGRKLGLSYFL